MTQSDSELSERDVRDLINLIGDAAHTRGDLMAKRSCLMGGLAELIGADVWLWVITEHLPEKNEWFPTAMLKGGLSDKEFAIIVEASHDQDHKPPEHDPWTSIVLSATGATTRGRRQLVPDDTYWYEHPNTKSYRQGFIDDFIFSTYCLDRNDNKYSMIGLHRHWGRDPFTPKQSRMAHIVMSEVKWLHACYDDGITGIELSPRLRGVLRYLLEGWSNKKIASEVGLSPHTVSDYVKDIYLHFGVHSRHELFNRFATGDGGDLT